MPLTPSETRDLLGRLQHFPKRALGQNFLVDGNIVRKSLELAQVVTGDQVIEIGPGLGTLTSALLETGAHVWAVEFDTRLHAHLSASLQPAWPQTLHLLQGDAVEYPLAGYNTGIGEFKVVANLPYAISTPWMDAVLSGPLPLRMVLMLQLEAAQRYTAPPGTKLRSAISVFLQAAYEAAPGHKVAAACFHPRPDIESYLLHIVRRETPFIFSASLRDLIRACFQQRRKQLGALLRDRLPDAGAAWFECLAPKGFDTRSRAEDIPTELWMSLQLLYRELPDPSP
ncbi:16S rRNA (adenine(1518)-N(6)/adenine(1519)-N(6))-dimethyltransferase RsmA [Nibricoccus sp. IMCC34717]|uniref:16S rRNA (adenine(1518)-N(6)/adenine(1519)-N(6))- dimethyltransferase RsmA n=1 Tax=Nibricoccus sp. IMCC34717 TaxID=3034021 RepID=UPI00384E322D